MYYFTFFDATNVKVVSNEASIFFQFLTWTNWSTRDLWIKALNREVCINKVILGLLKIIIYFKIWIIYILQTYSKIDIVKHIHLNEAFIGYQKSYICAVNLQIKYPSRTFNPFKRLNLGLRSFFIKRAEYTHVIFR